MPDERVVTTRAGGSAGRSTAVALLAAAVLSAAPAGDAVGGRLPAATTTPRPATSPTAGPAPSSTAAPAAPVDRAPAVRGLAREVDALLAVPAFDGEVSVLVADASSGEVLLDRGGGTARIPASVAKVRTGEAALRQLGPWTRLRTEVRELEAAPGPGQRRVVLVGGGDATLVTARAAGAAPPFAALTELADYVAAQLRDGSSAVRVLVDDAAFRGPAVSPDWKPTYVGDGEVAPVSALTVDGARVAPGDDRRVRDPAVAAGRTFAALLAARGVPVAGEVARAPAGAAAAGRLVGAVESPPVATLVEHMLLTSDNTLAESLARLAAGAAGEEPSFAGVGRLLSDRAAGVRQLDGSGLARGSRVPPEEVTEVLLEAAAGDDVLAPLLTGLPVAGFSGTLSYRFTAPGAAVGDVRGKTGTLSGVSGLAGTAVDATGGLLVFAVMADGITQTWEARATIDRVATAVADCPCSPLVSPGGGDDQ